MEKAESSGWNLRSQYATAPDGAMSFVVKFYRDKQLCYGLWQNGTNAKGKPSVTWGWGGACGTTTAPLSRLGDLVAMLGA